MIIVKLPHNFLAEQLHLTAASDPKSEQMNKSKSKCMSK